MFVFYKVIEGDEDVDSESEGFDHHEDGPDESDVCQVQQRAGKDHIW